MRGESCCCKGVVAFQGDDVVVLDVGDGEVLVVRDLEGHVYTFGRGIVHVLGLLILAGAIEIERQVEVASLVGEHAAEVLTQGIGNAGAVAKHACQLLVFVGYQAQLILGLQIDEAVVEVVVDAATRCGQQCHCQQAAGAKGVNLPVRFHLCFFSFWT